METINEPAVPNLGRIKRPVNPPLSFAQQRLWFLDRFLPDKALYNMPYAWRLKGPLNEEALNISLRKLVARHEALRTSFLLHGDEPVQVIEETPNRLMEVIRLEHLPPPEPLKQAEQLAGEEANKPFDLESGPMIRAKLYRLSEDDHLLQLVIHHIASDGWSMGILLYELTSFYNEAINGRESGLSPLPVQYADYAVWQRAWLQGKVLDEQLSYWKEQLAGLTTLELPADRPRPPVSSNRGEHLTLMIPLALTREIEKIGRSSGATLFMTLLAAFKVLLYRYSGQDDIAVGSPIAGRNEQLLEGLIGFFVNTLVLRDDLSGNPGFTTLLKQIRNTALDAYDHPDIPFEKLVEELAPERDLSRDPLFQVMFILQNTPGSELAFQELETRRTHIGRSSAKFDLKLALVATGEGLQAGWEYNTDLFDKETVERMGRHFINLLEAIVSDPDREIGLLPMLDEAERRQQLVDWNPPGRHGVSGLRLHELFEKQEARTPQAEALSFAGKGLSYRELNQQANQLAHFLIANGLQPETRVGVCLDRSGELVTSLLAILKAGGVYVPLDPGYPGERLAFMLEDAEAPILLTRQSLQKEIPGFTGKVLDLDAEAEAIQTMKADRPDCPGTPASPAYVIYTSGSTGTPKGMQLPHATLVNLIETSENRRPGGRVAQFTSISFDASLQEIFFALASGHTLVVLDEETRVNPRAFVEFLKKEKISDLFVPDTVLQYVLQAVNDGGHFLPDLRNIYQAGEPLLVSPAVRAFFKTHPDCGLHNLYGPAESHVVTTHRLGGDPDNWPEKPCIGKPIPHTRVYLLDAHLSLLPPGVPGEIHIAGDCLAAGYLNLPELTAKKFVKDPFSNLPTATLYRTGDLARYLPDGSMEFIGRSDHQVKIRGIRIEPGEIESLLGRHEMVKQALVLPREEDPGEVKLVAYLIMAQAGFSGFDALRAWLKERLPDYMIPSAFVTIDTFPLTANGKLDRRALPEPDYSQFSSADERDAPLDPVEARVAEAWREVLNLDQVGANDNFFGLGGHSLSAIRVNARLSETFKVNLPLRQFFETPTVAGLAAEVKKLMEES